MKKYASFDYLPFGDTLHVNTPENTKTSRERSGFIGKEKDAESGLGDFGVRKYDFLAGRFTSPDAMWEKYVGLTPYQYAGNNPLIMIDNNGREIHLQNLNEQQQKQWNAAVAVVRSWNSPTANAILDKAEGKKSQVFVNFFSDDRPVQGATKSNVGRSGTLEKEWNDNNKSNPSGLTLCSPESAMKGDIMMSSDKMAGNMNPDSADEINPFAISPLSVLDELGHAISTDRSGDKEKNDHIKLLQGLSDEIINGIINVSGTVQDQIEQKLQGIEGK